MISKAMDEHTGLEAAAMNPADALQAFRLAAHAVFDDWRQDPAVTTKAIQQATVRARHASSPSIDGEPALLRHEARVRFIPVAFRALAPRPTTVADSL
jgi:diacylglycerol kinase family enzyme